MGWKSKLLEYFSRKFVLALTSLVGGLVLLWFDKPQAATWIGIIAAVNALYNAANVAQDYVTVKRLKVETSEHASETEQ